MAAVIKILVNQSDRGSITASISKNGTFYTEIGCADLPELFDILSEHEIAQGEEKQPHPCITVTCQNCGNIHAASVLSEKYPIDEEWNADLARYARMGDIIEVKDRSEFNLDRCECEEQ